MNQPSSRPVVGLLDYGSGNLHSVARALTVNGAEVVLGVGLTDFADAAGLVVPGVGAFAACMGQLEAIGAGELLENWIDSGRRLLGICVGHQVLFAAGVEHGFRRAGFGVFPGVVESLDARRLPHMGWNTVQVPEGFGLLENDQRYYFVHSYAVHEATAQEGPSVPEDALVAWTVHEQDRFVAAVRWRNVTTTQFHPEKSGNAGARFLCRWIEGE